MTTSAPSTSYLLGTLMQDTTGRLASLPCREAGVLRHWPYDDCLLVGCIIGMASSAGGKMVVFRPWVCVQPIEPSSGLARMCALRDENYPYLLGTCACDRWQRLFPRPRTMRWWLWRMRWRCRLMHRECLYTPADEERRWRLLPPSLPPPPPSDGQMRLL